jgi:hypothetical protein
LGLGGLVERVDVVGLEFLKVVRVVVLDGRAQGAVVVGRGGGGAQGLACSR